jgi:CBS-domain-containing membrane protein
MKTILGDVTLSEVSVPRGTTFAEAADVLVSARAAMIAVVDERQRVVGLFGAEQALAGVLPGYLGDLRHTAFTKDDAALLAEAAAAVRDEPVERHAAEPVSVRVDASALHVGGVFLHTDLPALAVVENDRFVGMLDQAEFARAMLRRAVRRDP